MPRRLLRTGIPLHRQQGLLSLRMVQVEQYLQICYKVGAIHTWACLACRTCAGEEHVDYQGQRYVVPASFKLSTSPSRRAG